MGISTTVEVGYNYDNGFLTFTNPITYEMVWCSGNEWYDESIEDLLSIDEVVSFFERVQKSVDLAVKTVGLRDSLSYYERIVREAERDRKVGVKDCESVCAAALRISEDSILETAEEIKKRRQ